MKTILTLLALLMLAGTLSACGKKGPPMAPGPADQIIFPKQYPSS